MPPTSSVHAGRKISARWRRSRPRQLLADQPVAGHRGGQQVAQTRPAGLRRHRVAGEQRDDHDHQEAGRGEQGEDGQVGPALLAQVDERPRSRTAAVPGQRERGDQDQRQRHQHDRDPIPRVPADRRELAHGRSRPETRSDTARSRAGLSDAAHQTHEHVLQAGGRRRTPPDPCDQRATRPARLPRTGSARRDMTSLRARHGSVAGPLGRARSVTVPPVSSGRHRQHDLARCIITTWVQVCSTSASR